ncbi:MAG TPA: hypothetical protein VMR02_07120 [Terracidiphilus sp.]|nr:hypothetical protein [Terracidiphilus sp.]
MGRGKTTVKAPAGEPTHMPAAEATVMAPGEMLPHDYWNKDQQSP